eukprot:3925956-Prymnesium_polylepis.1
MRSTPPIPHDTALSPTYVHPWIDPGAHMDMDMPPRLLSVDLWHMLATSASSRPHAGNRATRLCRAVRTY